MYSDGAYERNEVLFSHPMYRDLREHSRAFSGLAAVSSFTTTAYVSPDRSFAGAHTEQATAELVSGNFFSVLGLRAILGRLFTDDDDRAPGKQPVAVISYAFWSRRFGQDPSAVGRTLHTNGTELTIIGVTPPEFFGHTLGRSTDIWTPLAMQSQVMREPSRLENRDMMWLRIIGRLRPDVTAGRAYRSTNDLFHRLMMEEAGSGLTPETQRTIANLTIDVSPFAKGISPLRRRISQPLWIVMCVVGLVLLIACANVSNLLLARAARRQREIALRLALGAGRKRLLRQLLTESLILALAGGALGLLLVHWSVDLILATISPRPVPLEVPLDGRILAFTLLISALTALAFGWVPALRSLKVDLISALREMRAAPDSRHFRLRKLLVISQVAGSLLLLFGAGLFLRSLQNLRSMEPGFDPEGVLLVEIDPQGGGYDLEELPNLYRELTETVESLPQVRSASLSYFNVFTSSRYILDATVAGFTPQTDDDDSIEATLVTPRYFETVGIPLALGRTLEWTDRDGAPKVAVVNETFARHFFPDRPAVGERFGIEGDGTSQEIEIVGVVKDITYHNHREGTPPYVYFPITQNMDYLSSMEIRTSGEPTTLVPQIRQVVNQVAGDLPILELRTLDDQMERSLHEDKLISRLTGFFSLLALTLTSIGIYGVMAYAMAQRTHEIGIRIALGASRTRVVRMALLDVLMLVGLGIALGIPAALASSRVASSLLFGLGTTDFTTLLVAVVVLAAVAAFAGYLPARRASRLDPATALRYE
jgi:predicted permease